MKKASIILRIISSSLLILLGVVLMIYNGGGWNFVGSNVANKTYNGDAYTGIQNAVAGTANNVFMIGSGLQNTIEDAYIFAGLFVLFIGLYMLGVTFASMNKEVKKQTEVQTASASIAVPSEISVLQNIEKYKKLLDVGAITQEEFDAKKSQLLGF